MSGRDRRSAIAPTSVGLALLVGCGRTQGTPAPTPTLVPALASASAPASASTLSPALVPGLAPDLPWPALVRDEEWDAAWQSHECALRDEDFFCKAAVAVDTKKFAAQTR